MTVTLLRIDITRFLGCAPACVEVEWDKHEGYRIRGGGPDRRYATSDQAIAAAMRRARKITREMQS